MCSRKKTKKTIYFLFILFLLFTIISCHKKINESDPEISILTPLAKAIYTCPGIIRAHIKISNTSAIKTIKVNITNANFIPIFGDTIFHTGNTFFEKNFYFKLSAPLTAKNGLYYFHVVAGSGSNIKNKYQPLFLKNKNVIFKGAYLFSANANGQTIVTRHIENKPDTLLLQFRGGYKSSAFSLQSNTLYILQDHPSVLNAFSAGDMKLQWNYSPKSPNAELAGLYKDDLLKQLLTGSAEGLIYGFQENNGILKFSTSKAQDTIPHKMITTDDYVVGEFVTRLNGNRLWMVFYRKSGTRIYRLPLQLKVIKFFATNKKNKIMLIANKAGKAFALWYDLANNIVFSEQPFGDGAATVACKLTGDEMIANAGQNLYYIHNGAISNVCTLDSNPIALAFDEINKHLFILLQHQLIVKQWPLCKNIETQQYSNQLTGIQLFYAYDAK